jgi:hypothetical protein
MRPVSSKDHQPRTPGREIRGRTERHSGMLGEFFAARADDIDEDLLADGPYGRLPTVEAKGLTPVTIATLGEILGAGSYDSLVERAAQGPEAEPREGEDRDAGVLTIPREIREALATVDELSTVADRWASTEELTLDEWQVEDAIEVLREVRELARDALAADRDLWYWWSL